MTDQENLEEESKRDHEDILEEMTNESKLYEIGNSLLGILGKMGMKEQLQDRVIKELIKTFEKKAKKNKNSTAEDIVSEVKPEFKKLIKEQYEITEDQLLIMAQAAKDKYK